MYHFNGLGSDAPDLLDASMACAISLDPPNCIKNYLEALAQKKAEEALKAGKAEVEKRAKDALDAGMQEAENLVAPSPPAPQPVATPRPVLRLTAVAPRGKTALLAAKTPLRVASLARPSAAPQAAATLPAAGVAALVAEAEARRVAAQQAGMGGAAKTDWSRYAIYGLGAIAIGGIVFFSLKRKL